MWTRGLSRPQAGALPLVADRARPCSTRRRHRQGARAGCAPTSRSTGSPRIPVTAVLEAEGEHDPPGQRVARQRVGAHRLGGRASTTCTASRRCAAWTRSSSPTSCCSRRSSRKGCTTSIIGDEAWDVDHFWHENPELKRGQHVWLTDFVGFLPMPDGGEHEAFLTTDYNAEMIEHIARYPWIRDRSIFVGNPDDIVADRFGAELPDDPRLDRGSTSRSPATSPGSRRRRPTRSRPGAPSSATATTSWCASSPSAAAASGEPCSTRSIAAYPIAKRQLPALRMIAVAGPRIDPATFPTHPGLEVHGYVDRLYRHLCVCDLAVVQGGLTTTMELAAAKRPFLYFPLGHHFEQNFHVRHRLDRYGAGRCMDYATHRSRPPGRRHRRHHRPAGDVPRRRDRRRRTRRPAHRRTRLRSRPDYSRSMRRTGAPGFHVSTSRRSPASFSLVTTTWSRSAWNS